MWGQKNGIFDSKSSGCEAKPPQWHACFFVSRSQQTEGHRPSANFVSNTAVPLCIAGMQKKKNRKQIK
jgi:hypothetical protein